MEVVAILAIWLASGAISGAVVAWLLRLILKIWSVDRLIRLRVFYTTWIVAGVCVLVAMAAESY